MCLDSVCGSCIDEDTAQFLSVLVLEHLWFTNWLVEVVRAFLSLKIVSGILYDLNFQPEVDTQLITSCNIMLILAWSASLIRI